MCTQAMERWRIIVFLFLLGLAFPVRSEQIILLGRIGEFPITATLEKKGEKLEGWYFYASKAKLIRLYGKLTGDGHFHLEETESVTSSVISGLFDGTAVEGSWTGIWRQRAEGPPLALELQVSNRNFANRKTSFRCTAQQRDKQHHYIYRSRLTLALSAGKVSQLSGEQQVAGDGGEEQACSIALDDLEPVPAATDLLLRADVDQTTSQSGRRTLRIVGNERLIWIHFGDPSLEGDDCRSANEVMFCSSRGIWNDIVLDRQTQKCRLLN